MKTYPYKAMMTPFEKLKSLDEAQQYLKPGITLETLDAIAMVINDNEAAKRLKEAKQQLFKPLLNRTIGCIVATLTAPLTSTVCRFLIADSPMNTQGVDQNRFLVSG